LSIGASLAFAAPAAALTAVFLAWGRGWLYSRGKGPVFIGLVFLPTFVLLAIPLDHVTVSSFAGCATSLRQTLNRISSLSLGTSTAWVLGTVRVAIGILAAACLVAAIRNWTRRGEGLMVLTGGTFAGSLGILLAAHRWLHAPFPLEGGMHLIPLATVSLGALFLKMNLKPAQLVLYAGGILLIVRYATVTDVRTYAGNEEFSGGKALAKALRAAVGRGGIDMGASETAEPVINYYRTRLRQGNWERAPQKPPTGRYDYYVLAGPDRRLVEERQLKVVYEDAGLVLARRQ
jgi:hypothetical protein